MLAFINKVSKQVKAINRLKKINKVQADENYLFEEFSQDFILDFS